MQRKFTLESEKSVYVRDKKKKKRRRNVCVSESERGTFVLAETKMLVVVVRFLAREDG